MKYNAITTRLSMMGAAAVAFACAPLQAQVANSTEPPESIAAMYDQLATSLARVTSLEYKAERVMTNHLPLPADAPIGRVMYDQLYYAVQGNSVYSRVEKTDSDVGLSTSWEGAYNGTEYQVLEHSGVLQKFSHAPDYFAGRYHSNQPIAVPLDFAFEFGNEYAYYTFLNQTIWERLVPLSEYVGVENVGGRLCDVVGINKVNPEFNAQYSYVVFLARELDYYPLKWELDVTPLTGADGTTLGEPTRTEGEVQTLVRQTSSGRVVVPVDVTLDVYWNGELGRTIQIHIDPATLRINQPLDESLFTIDDSRASRIVDRDSPTTAPARVLEVQQRRNWYFLFVVVLLAIASIAVLWRLRKKRSAGG